MRVLIAQTGPIAGDLLHNFAIIERYYELAKSSKADLCFFPELSTSGYYSEDLFLKKSFIQDIERHINQLIPKIGETALLLPTPIHEDEGLYNGVIAIQHGKIIGKSYKKYLPNEGIFDEKRYFLPGTSRVIEVNGHSIGVPICEDIWHPDVCLDLKSQGATLLLVPNGSPYEIDKMEKRLKITRERFNECGLPIVYCNQVLGQDGIVFDGRSFVYDGELKCQMGIFKEDYQIIELSLFQEQEKIFPCHPRLDPGSSKNYNSWIAAPRAGMASEHDEIYSALVFGLREYLRKNGVKSVVLGLSGGIDSALVAAIAVDAIGKVNVKAIMMPSKFTSRESLEDAEITAKMLGTRYEIKPIEDLVSQAEASIGNLSEIALENLQSRIRGLILMAISNSENSLVLTTGNKSEMAIGYATLYGDMCGGFNPIKDLYKIRVFELAKFRNRQIPNSIDVNNRSFPVMPDRVITKAPTAELKENQKDSDSLPDYAILDQILDFYIEQDLSSSEIVEKGFDKATVEKVIRLIKLAEFKRKQSAPGVKISSRNFEKDRRYPISQGYRE